MRRITACSYIIVVSLQLAEASSDRRLPPQQAADSSFRLRSHVASVEKYRYDDSQTKTGKSNTEENNQAFRLENLNGSSATAGPMEERRDISQKVDGSTIQRWKELAPRFDEIDRSIFSTALPLSALFSIMPLASALDLFWVNRLGETLAVAGQAAANQVYNSAFFLFAFLPSVTATLVSQSHASGDVGKTQDAVCQALILSLVISAAGTSLMFLNPAKALSSILKVGSPALANAQPYLRIRAFSFVPMLISFVGFSAFRGIMEVQTSVKIALLTNIITALLDPLLIHGLGIGVRGAALATVAGEYTSAAIYLKLLKDKGLIPIEKLRRLPAWSAIAPLLKGGIALQIRSFALNLTQLVVARVIQSIDDTGVAPAAHALAFQTFMLGGVVLGALGMASQTMVPNAMSKKHDSDKANLVNGLPYAQALVRRLFRWGVVLGFSVGLLQLFFLPAILSSSPLMEVREAARIPALIAISFQGINGIVSVGEGVMMGRADFTWLAISNIIAGLGYLGALQVFPKTLGLTGVWISLGLFTLLRLAGVLANLFVKLPSKKAALE